METDRLGRDLVILERFREIEDAITECDVDLAELADAVEVFRQTYFGSDWAAERSWLALHLARSFHGANEFEEAHIWALRSLADGPRRDTMCLLGEIAAELQDFRAAVSWYEAALGMSETPPYRGTRDLLPQYEIPGVLDRVRSRLQELRENVYPERRPIRRLKKPLRDAVVIVSAPRAQPTLPGLLESLRGARAVPHLIVDTEARGSAWSFLKALEFAVARDVDRLTYLQDDVIFSPGALDYIEEVELPDHAVFATWFAMHMPTPGPCWVFRPVRDFAMAQAVTLPRSTIDHVLASDVARAWPHRHLCDHLLAQAAPDGVYAIYMPSLVQHVGGLNSTIGNDILGPRTSPSFVGGTT